MPRRMLLDGGATTDEPVQQQEVDEPSTSPAPSPLPAEEQPSASPAPSPVPAEEQPSASPAPSPAPAEENHSAPANAPSPAPAAPAAGLPAMRLASGGDSSVEGKVHQLVLAFCQKNGIKDCHDTDASKVEFVSDGFGPVTMSKPQFKDTAFAAMVSRGQCCPTMPWMPWCKAQPEGIR